MNVRTAVCRFLTLLIVPCSGMYAAQQPGGTLDVSVRAHSTHGPLSGVYVALVPLDVPSYRPAMEAVVDGGVKWEGIPPGDYVLLAEAPSFEAATPQNIKIIDGKSASST